MGERRGEAESYAGWGVAAGLLRDEEVKKVGGREERVI